MDSLCMGGESSGFDRGDNVVSLTLRACLESAALCESSKHIPSLLATPSVHRAWSEQSVAQERGRGVSTPFRHGPILNLLVCFEWMWTFSHPANALTQGSRPRDFSFSLVPSSMYM